MRAHTRTPAGRLAFVIIVSAVNPRHGLISRICVEAFMCLGEPKAAIASQDIGISRSRQPAPRAAYSFSNIFACPSA